MAHDGEQVATGRSVLLIEREIEVLDFVDFSLPPPGLDFHPGESIERAHVDMIYCSDRNEAKRAVCLQFDLIALVKVQHRF
jgi:hypothetical protein